MIRRMLAALAVLALSVQFAPPAPAQVPKPGDEYADTVDLGFKIKMPDGWSFVPPQPGEPYTIGKYSAPNDGAIRNPKTGGAVSLDAYLLKFDRRAKSETTAKPEQPEGESGERPVLTRPAYKDIDEWIDKTLKGGWTRVAKESKDLNVAKIPAKQSNWKGEIDSVKLKMYTVVYTLQPDVDIAVLFMGPDDAKKWDKWENAYESLAKSFRSIAVTTKTEAARSASPRDVKRAALQKEVAKNPGWALFETPNYFVISSKVDDKQFIQELLERLEAIHAVYLEIYPPALAKELRELAKARRAAEAAKKAEEDKDKPVNEDPGAKDDAEWRTVAAKADPMELAKCSVVRVCKDDSEYSSYGGPGGSAGYWASTDEELVIYDDQKRGGRRNTWATLNHEAFHQYVFYFFGQLSPHSWYNEGTGDYFAGYEYEHKKFTLKPFNWRVDLIKSNLNPKQPNYAPLKDILRWTQAEYYGNNKLGLGGGENYAQGWSLIYFLRTGKKNAKGWNPIWEPILDTYLRTLVETDDLTAAVDKAFAGVDLYELETAWKKYTLSL